MDNNSLAHTKWECKYHIVFAPKYWRQVIYKDIKADVGQILGTLCRRNFTGNPGSNIWILPYLLVENVPSVWQNQL